MNIEDFKQQYIKIFRNEIEIEIEKVDEWLVNVVLPDFRGNGQVFKYPDNLTGTGLHRVLEHKGFKVESRHSHSGSYIYFNDDPKDWLIDDTCK